MINTDKNLSLDCRLGVGFGSVILYRGSKQIIDLEDICFRNYATLQEVEDFFKFDEDVSGDIETWRIELKAPLWNEIYERQSGVWILIEKGSGFA